MRNSRSALFLCGIALCFQTAIFGQDSDWTQINSGTIKSKYDVEGALNIYMMRELLRPGNGGLPGRSA